MLRVSRSVPGGFTTVVVYETGRSELKMVDTTHVDTVRRALLAALAADTSNLYKWFAERVRTAEIQQVTFSRVDLFDWKSYLTTLVWSDRRREALAVSGIGVDFRLGRIRLTVPSEIERARLEAALADAEIPCGLVETELGGFVVTAASDGQ